MCLNIKICKCLAFIEIKMSIFHPLDVVGRGSGTQLIRNKNENKVSVIRKIGLEDNFFYLFTLGNWVIHFFYLRIRWVRSAKIKKGHFRI